MKVKIRTIRQMINTGAEERMGVMMHTNHLWPFTEMFNDALPADRVIDVTPDTLPGHYIWRRGSGVKIVVQDWMIKEKLDEAKGA